MADERTRIVAGCMTGTSLDGLDAALVRITGKGLAMQAGLLAHHAVDLPAALRETLMSLASGEAHEPIVTLRAARALGELHAEALADLFAEHPNDKPDFVTAHGQTIWHAPRDGDDELGGGPKSWQLFDPWPIVRRLKLPVCYDLRQADLIAGGEGAPLTPIADWVMYRSGELNRVVVNLGGICNTTMLSAGGDLSSIRAEDVGPCNILLDGFVHRLFPGQRFDEDGKLGRQGEASRVVRDVHRMNFRKSGRSLASLGREQFDETWLDELLAGAKEFTTDPYDLMASAYVAVIEFVTARYVTEISPLQFRSNAPVQIVLCGGSAKNLFLVDSLHAAYSSVANHQTLVSDDLSIPCEAREAMGFAVLGALSQDGIPISLPQVTGATDPGVAGVWAGV